MLGSSRKLSIKAFSLSLASLFSFSSAILAILGMLGIGVDTVELFEGIFIGFEASAPGIFLGLVWGFLVGGLVGFIFSWLYNKML